jgi:hypothetical protein
MPRSKFSSSRVYRKRRGGSRSVPRSIPVHTSDFALSSFTPSISFTKKIRYTPKITTSSTVVTVFDLLDLMSIVNTGGSTGYRLCSAVRIRAIKLTVQPTFATTPNLVSNPVVLQIFNAGGGTFGGPAKIHTCESIGSSPGKTRVPLVGSYASQWFNVANQQQNLFNVSWVNESFYLDITIEFGLQNAYDNVQSASLVTQSISGTAGQIVILPLDGNTNSYLGPMFYSTA